MMVISLFIFYFTTSVAIVQNPISPYERSSMKPVDETLSHLIDAFKDIEAYSKEWNEKQSALFPKGVQQAYLSADGQFTFPPNCSLEHHNKTFPYCFHGVVEEDENKTTTADVGVDFFDLYNPVKNVRVGFKAVYNESEKLQSDILIRTGGEAELMDFGSDWLSAGISIATEPPNFSSADQLWAPRNNLSFITRVGLGLKLVGKPFVHAQEDAQESKVFAFDSYKAGFNISNTYTTNIYGFDVGVTFSLTLMTVKNTFKEWKLRGKAQLFYIILGRKVAYDLDYISVDIKV